MNNRVIKVVPTEYLFIGSGNVTDYHIYLISGIDCSVQKLEIRSKSTGEVIKSRSYKNLYLSPAFEMSKITAKVSSKPLR